jgi:Aminotransferase class-V
MTNQNTDRPKMNNTTHPAERILLGPGPSPVPQRVLRAMSAPTLGHLDPQYLAILDETCEMLRQVFQTRNLLTFPVSSTGMAGMECIAVNLIEPGDEVIVCVNGVFGMRMKDVMERCGATVHAVEAPWGEIIQPEQIAAALDQYPKSKLVGIVHAETSTGAHQPLAGLADPFTPGADDAAGSFSFARRQFPSHLSQADTHRGLEFCRKGVTRPIRLHHYAGMQRGFGYGTLNRN